MPVAKLKLSPNDPSPVPRRTVMFLDCTFSVARSRRPSPLKSAVTTETALAPTSADLPALKVPSRSLVRIETRPESHVLGEAPHGCTTARSCPPSASKSSIARAATSNTGSAICADGSGKRPGEPYKTMTGLWLP